MPPRTRSILFTLFAPLTVPVYLLFLAGTNLLGGAFYIVIEASLARILGRPISLPRWLMALLALPVVALAPVATAVHFLLWFLRLLLEALRRIGYWQTGTRKAGRAFAAGLLWTLAAVWVTTTCLNAAAGFEWVGGSLAGREAFVHHLTRFRTLGEMPADMQERRRALINELRLGKEAVDPRWEQLLAGLEDDEWPFDTRWLPETVLRRLANLPWFFVPSEVSVDGADHSVLLLGPLLFVWMLLVRWPGTFAVLRPGAVRGMWFLLRTVGAVYALWALVTWIPHTADSRFWFEAGEPGRTFRMLSPALWLGSDLGRWVRPEWYLFNAGLWMALLGMVAFVWRLAWRISPFLGWPRYYVAFLASRLLQRRRIAFFSVGAVTLCVAMMIIVISVMGGFVDSIRERAHGLLGDLVMDGGLAGFPYYETFIEELGKLRDEETGKPLVAQVTPLIHSYGILQFPKTKKTKTVRVWGIRLEEYVKVNEFGKDLYYQKRFGATTLASRSKPVYGFDEKGVATLPGEMDRHYRQYVASLPPEERSKEEKRFHRGPGEAYPGPGIFDMSTARDPQPGFEEKPLFGMIIGRDIIARRMPSGEYRRSLNYPCGEHCYLTVMPLTRTGDVSAEPPPKPSFRYVDDSRTGIHEIDSMNVYVDFGELQRLLSMGPMERADGSGFASARCSQIQIKLHETFSEDRRVLGEKLRVIEGLWQRLRQELPADAIEDLLMDQVDIQTWEEMQQSYISAIEKEKFLVLIMFGVISIVAVFLILCIFYMIVQEKTRDIGIIKSVGGSAEGIIAMFLAYGGAIGLVGCVLGALLGTTFVEHINEVQDFLARMNPDWRVWSPETYSFDKIPDFWKWSEVIAICILAVVASIAGAAFPAIRAGRTWPVESLRYE